MGKSDIFVMLFSKFAIRSWRDLNLQADVPNLLLKLRTKP